MMVRKLCSVTPSDGSRTKYTLSAVLKLRGGGGVFSPTTYRRPRHYNSSASVIPLKWGIGIEKYHF